MESKLIIMLTHHDKTVKNAIDIFEENKDLPVSFWGFKDVGLDKENMRTLVENMRQAGKKTFLEVVTYTEAECMDGARLAVEYGFDYLMGTVYYKSVHDYLNECSISYLPFCGKVSGSPSVLEGSNEEIIEDAKDLIEKGIKGFDLLAYRHVIDGEKLAEDFIKAISVPVVIAGSINSFGRIDKMARLDPWAFTMGSALFDKCFIAEGTFRQNLQSVVEYMKMR